MAKLVSKTYGDALFDVAMESGRLDEYLSEAGVVKQVLQENEDLVRLMNHPKVPKEEKVELLENCFTDKISKELLGTLRLIIIKDRANDMMEVLDYFITRVKEYKNIGFATVTSSVELSEANKEKIKAKLLETTNYVEFEIDYKVDSSIIGGLIIRIKDRVVDSSIRTKIETLARKLSETKVESR